MSGLFSGLYPCSPLARSPPGFLMLSANMHGRKGMGRQVLFTYVFVEKRIHCFAVLFVLVSVSVVSTIPRIVILMSHQ